MADVLVRVVVVIVVALAAVGAGRIAGRFRQPTHPTLDLAGTDLPTGVVLFTSTDCTNCAAARLALQRAGVEFREVTWELEGPVLESVHVEAVPLAVFRDASGRTVAQIGGVPRSRALRRAAALAGR